MTRDTTHRAGQSSGDGEPSAAAEARGTSRRRFLQLSSAAGVAVAAATVVPGRASAAPVQNPSNAAGANMAPGSAVFDPIRPPAIPLAVRSPYLSTWLGADNSAGTWPSFWTGRTTAMGGMIRIDGTAYLFLGSEPALNPPVAYPLPTMREISVEVTPTRSQFVLQQAGVELDLTFLSPVEPGDLPRQSRPLSYVVATATSIDGNNHDISVYLDISGEWASGSTGTVIGWNEQRYSAGGASVISLNYAPTSPRVLTENNDTAEWGTVVWSSQDRSGLTWQIGGDAATRTQFVTAGSLSNTADPRQPRAISDQWPVFGFCLNLGSVGRKATAPFVISVGHVREPAVSYLGTPLPPLWKSYYADWQGMVGSFHVDYTASVARADTLDAKISKDALKAGGEQYAALCALALRQAYGGTELVSHNGEPWAFLKEISSDGNVSTVDVTYPCMPVFLYADPAYLGLILAPLLEYAETGGWPKTFAEHDIGRNYPNAAGHNDGNEEDMPVEESANMLIMSAAYLARADATARSAFATKHYPILKQWGDYLVANALDPGNQNQTDDFTGFIAHSVNLALKGIIAIGAMGQIATAAGKTADAASYTATSRSYISQWVTKATDSSGKHLKLAYDQDGTWSLKYNGYPDRLLGLGLIPSHVADIEAAWYLSRANTYGVPLDLRHTYTKNDWEMWTAAWLKDHPDLRSLLVSSVYEFADTSARRVPTSDWYDTVTGQTVGFQARPVVGGFFSLLTV